MSKLRHQQEIKERQNNDKQDMKKQLKKNIEKNKLDEKLKQHKIKLQQRQQQATDKELQRLTTFKQRMKKT